MINLPAYIGAIASDMTSAKGFLGASILGVLVSDLLQKRLNAAVETLEEELKKGDLPAELLCDENEAAAVFFRYARAAQEGTARFNLKLMARVVRGLAIYGNLKSDEFLYYADILSSLKYEEILLAAKMYKNTQIYEQEKADGIAEPATPHKRTSDELIGTSWFPSEDYFLAVAGAVSRTGLVILKSGFGSLVINTSPLMAKLYELACLEEVLHQELEPAE